MNGNNINLFSTFFPLNFIDINKNKLSKNNSLNNLSKEKLEENYINIKTDKVETQSFAFLNSGKFKNINSFRSLFPINKNMHKIPLIKINNNNLEFNYNLNNNLSNDIINNNTTKLNLSKNIFDPNYLNKNKIVFNKNRNYFSKDSINILKYLNYKNLYNSKNIININNSILNKNIKKLNKSNDNKYDMQINNNHKDNLNNYLTVYNFKSIIFKNKVLKKNESKINYIINKSRITLPKMLDKKKKTFQNDMNFNNIYGKESNSKTFFPQNSNALLFQKTIFNKTKMINKEQRIKKKKNKGKLLLEVISIPGKTFNKEKINQDTYMILPNKVLSNNNILEFPGLIIFGIFDGHGEFGDVISNEVKTYFIEYFNKLNYDSNNNFEKLSNNNYKEIYSIFNQIDKNLHIKYKSNNICYNSGTTAHLLLLFKNKIISVNIGDSKSILIFGNNDDIIQLNTCHNPEKEEEKKRIEKNGGEVGRVNWADYGPQRVWYKGRKYPGLSISRSFGDFVSEPLGVFSVPEIKEFDVDYTKAKIIVIATDGIWEFLSNEKVRDIIIPYYKENNIQGCINKLMDIASKIWNIKNPKYIDDLSVILLFFI